MGDLTNHIIRKLGSFFYRKLEVGKYIVDYYRGIHKKCERNRSQLNRSQLNRCQSHLGILYREVTLKTNMVEPAYRPYRTGLGSGCPGSDIKRFD